VRLAILDDYHGVAFKLADWSKLKDVAVVSYSDHVYDADRLIERLSEFDAVMRIRERTHFPRSVLERLPRLKLLLATGMRNTNSVDLAAAQDLGIIVCTTDAIHATTVELVWAFMLNLFRRVPQESASLRAGGWQLELGGGLVGKTLGILGLGNMGIPVARIAQAFEMKVIAWSPNLTAERAAEHQVECVSKADLFSRSDALTIHVPQAAATVGIVSAADLARMKPTAFLINTSRPQLVDQPALIDALTHRRIAGAGIDVFDIEPLPLDHPYRSLPTVLATPHIGFVTQENYRIFFEESFQNLEADLKGAPIRVVEGVSKTWK
jgi:phosphoglycerate dehydrogenase-like enzyme